MNDVMMRVRGHGPLGGRSWVGAAIAVPRSAKSKSGRGSVLLLRPRKTPAHRRGPSEDAIHAIEYDRYVYVVPPTLLSTIMTHFSDALSGIVRQFYTDPVHFSDHLIVVGSQLGWISITTW